MTCARLWSVEAARDGRLAGAEAAIVAKHIPLCPDCAEESRRLETLALALRSLPLAEMDAVSLRREKQRLLAAVDAKVVAPSTRLAPRALAAAVLVVAVVSLVVLSRRRPVAVAQTVSAPALASVEERGQTSWSRQRDGRRETITLTEGTLSLRVRRTSPEDRVLVVAPDGEIEDEGTTFSVEVSRLHTERVVVVDGAVIFRRHGEPPIRLHAGESWTRRPDAPSSASATPAESPLAAKPSAPPVVASLPRKPEAPVKTPPAASTSEFQDGFRALEDGNNGVAADRLSGVVDRATDDARAEDAAYLRIVALARAGARDKARDLARDYLKRFPRGFRRPEVEAIAK